MSARGARPGPRTDQSNIEFHRGNVMGYLSNTYAKLPQTIQECVQNGFDAGADRIIVCIDLHNQRVIVTDNGDGTDREQFEKALASVGRSIKHDARPKKGDSQAEERIKLGRFGLGLISPLSKCGHFTFASAPLGQRQALRWTFRAADIERQDTTMSIPCESLSRLPALPKRFAEFASDEFAVEYNTTVTMHDVTTDRVTSNIDVDQLANDIRIKFVAPMRQRKGKVRIVMFDVNDRFITVDVDPLQYTGEPLPIITFEGAGYEKTGRIEFELYRARRVGGQRKGLISVVAMGDNFPIDFRSFVGLAQLQGIASIISESIGVLNSGYFEGIIRCENIVLAPSRKSFVHDDALEGLYLTLDDWYRQFGRNHYAEETDQTRQARWQELGLKSLNKLHQLLHLPEYANLWEGLRFVVEYGRLGGGHLEPERGELDGPDGDPSLRVGQGGVGVSKGESDGGSSGPRQREPKDRPGDTPLTASGPTGNRRRLVKGDSQGLQLAYAELPGDSRLWTFDFQDGTITFNTIHDLWARLDETNSKHTARNARWILHLQEWLTLSVLHLLLKYPDEAEFSLRRDIVDDQIRHYIDLFILDNRK